MNSDSLWISALYEFTFVLRNRGSITMRTTISALGQVNLKSMGPWADSEEPPYLKATELDLLRVVRTRVEHWATHGAFLGEIDTDTPGLVGNHEHGIFIAPAAIEEIRYWKIAAFNAS